MRLLEDKLLYSNIDHCMEFLRHIPPERSHNIIENMIFHTYWSGDFSAKQALSIKSFLATQDLNKQQVWLWLDSTFGWDDYTSNPFLQPLLPYLTIRKFSITDELDDVICNLYSAKWFDHVAGKYYRSRLNFLLHQRTDFANRANIFRLLILYKYGGFYSDLDVFFLRSLADLTSICSMEFCYQWATRPHANSAILRFDKQSTAITYLLYKAIRNNNFKPWNLFDLEDKGLDLLMLPGPFFDPLWLHFDQVDKTQQAPFNDFADFFRPIKDNVVPSYKDFFRGCFTYHWHNRWKDDEFENSYAGIFNKEIDLVLETRYGCHPHKSFQRSG